MNPTQLQITFADNTDVVTLASILPGAIGYTGTAMFHDTSYEEPTLLTQFATDFFAYTNSEGIDVVYNGIAAWQPESISDYIEFEWVDNCVTTRIQNTQWNGWPEELLHDDGSEPCPTVCPTVVIPWTTEVLCENGYQNVYVRDIIESQVDGCPYIQTTPWIFYNTIGTCNNNNLQQPCCPTCCCCQTYTTNLAVSSGCGVSGNYAFNYQSPCKWTTKQSDGGTGTLTIDGGVGGTASLNLSLPGGCYAQYLGAVSGCYDFKVNLLSSVGSFPSTLALSCTNKNQCNCCGCPTYQVTVSGVTSGCSINGTYNLIFNGDPATCKWVYSSGGNTINLTMQGGNNSAAQLTFVTSGGCVATYNGLATNCTGSFFVTLVSSTGSGWPGTLQLICEGTSTSSSSSGACVPAACPQCISGPYLYLVSPNFPGTSICATYFNNNWDLAPIATCTWQATQVVLGQLVTVTLHIDSNLLLQNLTFSVGTTVVTYTSGLVGPDCCNYPIEWNLFGQCPCDAGYNCNQCNPAPTTYQVTFTGMTGEAPGSPPLDISVVNGISVTCVAGPQADGGCYWVYVFPIPTEVAPGWYAIQVDISVTNAGVTCQFLLGTEPLLPTLNLIFSSFGSFTCGNFLLNCTNQPFDIQGQATLTAGAGGNGGCPESILTYPMCCGSSSSSSSSSCPCLCSVYSFVITGSSCSVVNTTFCLSQIGSCAWTGGTVGVAWATLTLDTNGYFTLTIMSADGSNAIYNGTLIDAYCNKVQIYLTSSFGDCYWPSQITLLCQNLCGSSSSSGSGTTTLCCALALPNTLVARFNSGAMDGIEVVLSYIGGDAWNGTIFCCGFTTNFALSCGGLMGMPNWLFGANGGVAFGSTPTSVNCSSLDAFNLSGTAMTSGGCPGTSTYSITIS